MTTTIEHCVELINALKLQTSQIKMRLGGHLNLLLSNAFYLSLSSYLNDVQQELTQAKRTAEAKNLTELLPLLSSITDDTDSDSDSNSQTTNQTLNYQSIELIEQRILKRTREFQKLLFDEYPNYEKILTERENQQSRLLLSCVTSILYFFKLTNTAEPLQEKNVEVYQKAIFTRHARETYNRLFLLGDGEVKRKNTCSDYSPFKGVMPESVKQDKKYRIPENREDWSQYRFNPNEYENGRFYTSAMDAKREDLFIQFNSKGLELDTIKKLIEHYTLNNKIINAAMHVTPGQFMNFPFPGLILLNRNSKGLSWTEKLEVNDCRLLLQDVDIHQKRITMVEYQYVFFPRDNKDKYKPSYGMQRKPNESVLFYVDALKKEALQKKISALSDATTYDTLQLDNPEDDFSQLEQCLGNKITRQNTTSSTTHKQNLTDDNVPLHKLLLSSEAEHFKKTIVKNERAKEKRQQYYDQKLEVLSHNDIIHCYHFIRHKLIEKLCLTTLADRDPDHRLPDSNSMNVTEFIEGLLDYATCTSNYQEKIDKLSTEQLKTIVAHFAKEYRQLRAERVKKFNQKVPPLYKVMTQFTIHAHVAQDEAQSWMQLSLDNIDLELFHNDLSYAGPDYCRSRFYLRDLNSTLKLVCLRPNEHGHYMPEENQDEQSRKKVGLI